MPDACFAWFIERAERIGAVTGTSARCREFAGQCFSIDRAAWRLVRDLRGQGARSESRESLRCLADPDRPEEPSARRDIGTRAFSHTDGRNGGHGIDALRSRIRDRSVALQIGDAPVGAPARFQTCLPVGCVVQLRLDSKTLSMMCSGTSIKMVGVAASDGRRMLFTLPLTGLGAAVDRAGTCKDLMQGGNAGQ